MIWEDSANNSGFTLAKTNIALKKKVGTQKESSLPKQHLKLGAWKMILSFWEGWSMFKDFAVSFRSGTWSYTTSTGRV